jgi:type II secretory ATPase GspE/PulE/Tfp pilus assembly ATPase PilB-like protein
MMEVDHPIREMIANRTPEFELSAYLQKKGRKSLERAAIDRAVAGECSLEDVMRTLDVTSISVAPEAAA